MSEFRIFEWKYQLLRYCELARKDWRECWVELKVCSFRSIPETPNATTSGMCECRLSEHWSRMNSTWSTSKLIATVLFTYFTFQLLLPRNREQVKKHNDHLIDVLSACLHRAWYFQMTRYVWAKSVSSLPRISSRWLTSQSIPVKTSTHTLAENTSRRNPYQCSR